jgi:hypothetical protein
MSYWYFDDKCPIHIPIITKRWANKKKIKNTFEKLQIGLIDRIDIKKNGNNYKAFVYFKTWYDTLQNRHIQSKMLDPKQIAKLVYDDPNYWILLKCKYPCSSTEIYLQSQITTLQHLVIMQQEEIYQLYNDVRNIGL